MSLDPYFPFAYFSSPQDWLIIALVAVVLFGGKKIPELARGMGEGIREFKKSVSGVDDSLQDAGNHTVTGSSLPSKESEQSPDAPPLGNVSR